MKKLNLTFINQRRNELDLTLQTMAEQLGFKNASTYMKYEKGDYSFKADHLPILSKILVCEINDLFFENNFAEIAKKQPA